VTSEPSGAPKATGQDASTVLAEDRLQRLQRVSLDLNAAMSIDDIATAVIDVLDAPVTAPSRSLYVLEDGSDHLVLVAERGMPPQAAAMFQRLPLDADLPGSVAVRELRTVVTTTPSQAVEEFARLRDVPRSTSGFIAIPLVSDRGCVGVLGIGVDDVLDDHHLGFFEAVGAQVAQSLMRVRLLERERRRHVELEFLAQLTGTALDAHDHVDLMRRVCTAAVPTLGDWCSLYFVAETGEAPEVAFAHVDPEKESYLAELMERYPFDPDAAGVASVIRSGETEFVPRLTREVIDEAIASSKLSATEAMPILERLGITSAITVAMRTKRRVVGAMQFVSAESGRHYDRHDVALAEAVAGRLAEALDAAWMSDHQRSVAVTLQKALLPPALPTIPGVNIVARYWPAGIDRVGGDFYDVFPIGGHEWALVIGDVCGSGPDAAALTAIARHTIRAAARHGAAAEVVIDWLNEAVLQSQRDLFCTVCYATLAVTDDGFSLTSTAAGHPLPLVSSALGAHTVGRPGTLVGMFERVTTATERVALHNGDVVVLYTDGITDLSPPHGIEPEELLDLVHAHRHGDPDKIADAVHRSLDSRVPDRVRRDDAAILVVQIR
jgi:serine phosphatase RsbU (regulator of sigma subunit)